MAAQDDFGILKSFVEWAGIEGDEAEAFVKEMMGRKGHKPVTSWADADKNEGDGKKPDNVFGLNLGGPKKASGAGWQY